MGKEPVGLHRNARVHVSFGNWDNAGNDSHPNARIPLTTDYLPGLRIDPVFYIIFFLFI